MSISWFTMKKFVSSANSMTLNGMFIVGSLSPSSNSRSIVAVRRASAEEICYVSLLISAVSRGEASSPKSTLKIPSQAG